MSLQKLEPRLQEHLAQRAQQSAGPKSAPGAGPEPTIEVTISMADSIEAVESTDRDSGIRSLGEQTRKSQSPLTALLKKLGVTETIAHSLTNAVTAKLTPPQLAQVSELDEVRIIRLEGLDLVTCMTESPRVIELPEAQTDFRADGRGIRVAVLDSGVDPNHPALLGKVVDQFDATGTGIGPGLHGTHVAGTVASNDPLIRGVAPQCDVLNIKVLTAAGAGVPAWVITGLDQAVRRGALVANLSLGWSEIFHGWVCNDADCILCEAVDNAVRLGMTVVVAAGNEGAGAGRIRHPGAARRAITVGATDKAKVLTAFSSRGPSSGRLSPFSAIRLTKPDICAPGLNIQSSIPPNAFANLSGTSMASPHVAGLVALMIQKNRSLTPMMIKKILEETAEPIIGQPNEVGYGLINAYGAVMRATASAGLALSATT